VQQIKEVGMFEYRVVDSVEEANRLAQDGYEIFYIVAPPAPDGVLQRDHIYLRREAPRAGSTGFAPNPRGK